MRLRDRVSIVTGAGSGIGRAVALGLAGEGSRVVLVGRTPGPLEETKRQVEVSGGAALVCPGDVGDPRAVRATVEATLQAYGRVDVLVNNAGYNIPQRGILEMAPEQIEGVVRGNLTGSLLFIQAVLPAMLKARAGTVVNVSSIAAKRPALVSGAAYSAAKAGLITMTRVLNLELHNTGVRVCVVIPGATDTPLMDKRVAPPSKEARAAMLTPDDVAEAILLAVLMPGRALVEEVVIRPTVQVEFRRQVPPPAASGA
ncbi:MAG: SDR family oxidoreductase [Chloroflexi bacterium]|nr:SDR family oxidoreductase [Chloroflexota bacterium]